MVYHDWLNTLTSNKKGQKKAMIGFLSDVRGFVGFYFFNQRDSKARMIKLPTMHLNPREKSPCVRQARLACVLLSFSCYFTMPRALTLLPVLHKIRDHVRKDIFFLPSSVLFPLTHTHAHCLVAAVWNKLHDGKCKVSQLFTKKQGFSIGNRPNKTNRRRFYLMM